MSKLTPPTKVRAGSVSDGFLQSVAYASGSYKRLLAGGVIIAAPHRYFHFVTLIGSTKKCRLLGSKNKSCREDQSSTDGQGGAVIRGRVCAIAGALTVGDVEDAHPVRAGFGRCCQHRALRQTEAASEAASAVAKRAFT